MKSSECACCREGGQGSGSGSYCQRCVGHQRLYALGLALVFAASVAVAWYASNWMFAWMPFAGRWVHGCLVFGLCVTPPIGLLIVLRALPSDPVHGHWGKAIHEVVDGEGGHLALYRNLSHGHEMAKDLPDMNVREVREPQTGWTLLLLLCAALPSFVAAVASYRFGDRQFTLYIDNGSGLDFKLRAGDRNLGHAPAGEVTVLQIPRVAMRVDAINRDGQLVESLTIGGLDEIVADAYENLFPDLEYDVADKFVWNVLQKRCYRESTQMYGMGVGTSDASVHHKKAFHTDSEEPFKRAPASIESMAGIGSRRQLVRVLCD